MVFLGFMFSIQELQYEDNLLRQFCNPSFDRDKIMKGAFVWDQSGIRMIGIMQVSVRLAALPIPEYLDFQNIFLFQNIPKRTRPKSSA